MDTKDEGVYQNVSESITKKYSNKSYTFNSQ